MDSDVFLKGNCSAKLGFLITNVGELRELTFLPCAVELIIPAGLVRHGDLVTVQAIVVVITLVFILANLMADLLHRWLTPRLAASPA